MFQELPQPRPRMSRRRALTLGGTALVAAVGLGAGIRGASRQGRIETGPRVDDDPSDIWPPLPLGLSQDVPTAFRFSVARGVSASDERLLREAAVLARDFYRRTLGVYLTNRPMIHLTLAANREALGDADTQTVRIYVASPAWPRLSRVDKIEVVCHEVFHLFQATLSKGWYPTPLYLLEGAAEYAGQSAVVDAGLRSREEFLSTQAGIVARYPQPRIGDVDRDSGSGSYAVGALAVDQIVGARGTALLGAYFDLLRDQVTQQEAFSRAFGETRPAFEERFERWRAVNGIAAR